MQKIGKIDEQLLISCTATKRTNEWTIGLTDNWTNKAKFVGHLSSVAGVQP